MNNAEPTAQRFAGDIENARQNRAGIERRNGPGTRFSILEDAKAEINQLLSGQEKRGSIVLTDGTPSIMLGHNGVRNLPLAMKPSHVNTKSDYNQVYIDTNTVGTVFGREICATISTGN